MLNPRSVYLSVILLCAGGAVSSGSTLLHHDLSVQLDPANHSIRVTDELSLGSALAADDDGSYRFVLHAGLAPEVLSEGWRLESAGGPVEADFLGINATTETVDDRVALEGWRLLPPADGAASVKLSYGGVIHHPLATQGEEYQRSFSETPGTIGEEGVFLAGTSFWVPTFGDGLMSFRLEVNGLVPPWDVVSQGRRELHETDDGARTTVWSFEHPTEEVYLVAGRWHEYADQAGAVEVFAFLRGPDPGLAERYLTATKRYLKMYEAMLPRYPFASFALVENFWETGYGMPGFTLLGPQVIRFPWILSSSYPHELLHNWWGNSAYVDFDRGNWCEGLTAYMADHLLAEQRGEAAVYRRSTLKKYTDFVGEGSDLPLTDFSSRRSAATEAVGYGKSLMIFHMIRRAVGDEVFLRSLSRFYDEHRFSRVSFAEIAAAVSAETGAEWGPFMESWTSRTGAPELAITRAEVSENGDGQEAGYALHLELAQTQQEAPYEMMVPVAVTVEGQEDMILAEVFCGSRVCELDLACPARPLQVSVDPSFDVMRRLDPLEVPPALSTIFGADDALFVLPGDAPEDELKAWRELATQWARPGEARTVLDSEVATLPDGMVWLLGWSNRHAGTVLEPLSRHGVAVDAEGFTLAGDRLARADHSLILVARGAGDPETAVGWVTADPVAAIPGLGRKLPHYTKYSYLAFRGDEPTNVAKGVWPTIASPLSRALAAGETAAPALPERRALAELPPAFSVDALLKTAAALADPALEGRGLGTEGLQKATEWVEAELAKAGLEPAGSDGFRQMWSWQGGAPSVEMELTNLVARVPGSDPELGDQPVLVMAHLDHLGRGWPEARAEHRGEIHPGADDNASGVAVLLELAKTLASEPPRARPVLFAVVTGEEAGLLGSRHLLGSMAEGALPASCINLDTVGRLSDGKLYVINADSAREWRFIFMGVGYTTGAPVSVVSEPLDASDQAACIEKGVPAVQLFSGPNEDYHRPSDTADKLDGEGLVVVTAAVHETVAYLADRVEPLTVTIAGAAEGTPAHGGAGAGARKVSLGTMPDFGYDGPGVRVQRVMDDSPAAAAGILAGDVVVAIDGEKVADLRSYSNILKSRQPGDAVNLTLNRDGQELTVRAVLVQR